MQNNQAWNETFGDDDEKKAEAMEEMAWRTACSSSVDDFPKFEECIRERHPNLRSNHPPLLLSTVCTVTVIGANFSQEGPLVILRGCAWMHRIIASQYNRRAPCSHPPFSIPRRGSLPYVFAWEAADYASPVILSCCRGSRRRHDRVARRELPEALPAPHARQPPVHGEEDRSDRWAPSVRNVLHRPRVLPSSQPGGSRGDLPPGLHVHA